MYINNVIICYIIFSKTTVFEVKAFLKIIDTGVQPLDKETIAIQFYLDVENRDRLYSCKVKSWTRRCCYTDSDKNDSDSIAVYGSNIQTIKPKARETLIYVYPTIIHENHIGTCEFVLEHRCGRDKKVKREEVSIPFDTRAKKSTILLNHLQKSSICPSLDQDVMNNCEPVNCDLKYVGRRYFYNDEVDKCVAAPICDEDPTKELPDIIYDPKSNTCKDLENPLSIADVYAITYGLGIVSEPLNSTGLSVTLQSNCSTISENIKFLRDLMHGQFCPTYKGNVPDFSSACDAAIFTIILSILLVTFLVLGLVCCIYSSLWIFKKVRRSDLRELYAKIKFKLNKDNLPKCGSKKSKVNKDITNKLLKDVIVTDIPIELRESFENICERINRELKSKKRYRREDLGSRINLAEVAGRISATSSATSLLDNDDRCRPICKNRRREWKGQIQNTSAELLLERKPLAESFRRYPMKVYPNSPCPLLDRTRRITVKERSATDIPKVVRICQAPIDDKIDTPYLNHAEEAKRIGAWDAVRACCAFCECGSCCPCGVRDYILRVEERAARCADMKRFDTQIKTDWQKMRIMYNKI